MKNSYYQDISSGKIKPFGVYNLPSGEKLGIYTFTNNEKQINVAVSAFINDDNITSIRQTIIYCDAKGERNYIIRRGKRFYLDMYS